MLLRLQAKQEEEEKPETEDKPEAEEAITPADAVAAEAALAAANGNEARAGAAVDAAADGETDAAGGAEADAAAKPALDVEAEGEVIWVNLVCQLFACISELRRQPQQCVFVRQAWLGAPESTGACVQAAHNSAA